MTEPAHPPPPSYPCKDPPFSRSGFACTRVAGPRVRPQSRAPLVCCWMLGPSCVASLSGRTSEQSGYVLNLSQENLPAKASPSESRQRLGELVMSKTNNEPPPCVFPRCTTSKIRSSLALNTQSLVLWLKSAWRAPDVRTCSTSRRRQEPKSSSEGRARAAWSRPRGERPSNPCTSTSGAAVQNVSCLHDSAGRKVNGGFCLRSHPKAEGLAAAKTLCENLLQTVSWFFSCTCSSSAAGGSVHQLVEKLSSHTVLFCVFRFMQSIPASSVK